MKKKGFTLIELLAVIVILAVIAIIVTPMVMNTIESSRANSFKQSALNIIEASKNDCYAKQVTGEECTPIENLQYSGKHYDNIFLNNTNPDAIAIAIYDGIRCAYGTENNMNVIKTTLDKCKTLSDGNLFINGHQELKNNNYFKGFTYNSTENCLTLTNSEYYETLGDDYVAIDSNKKYQFSITVKTNNSDAVYYAGIREFDVDKRWITPVSYRYYPNTLTTLKQDLKPGDTKIYVDNLSNWRDSNSWGWRNVIFWNYKDSTGYEYPPETYSQNTIFDAWDYNTEALDKINNIIKLKSSWSGETIPIGTKISEDHAANWSNYGILPAIKITDSYQTYSVVITGTDLKSTDSIDMFRPASKYVKFIFLSNYYGTAKPTTIYVKDITMREVK